MYIEVCKHCVPAREYVRTIDVTEKTSTFKHTTGRRCYRCGEPLVDTIVHFGERGKLRWPLNWQGACQAAKACDTILCLGSSLKVLRKYTWLWQTHRPLKRRPNLFIVNLQWTPKDKDATLKINGKCDDVMKLVMNKLGLEVPHYKKVDDPIFQISTPLHIDEISTITRPPIEPPNYSPDQMVPLSEDIDKMNSLLNNYRSV
ncbi:NAD-dependent protein deacetylase sirtuin-7 [Armadillidium nasatum]|uniref:Regulatory protein SIR2 homolog 7 n=1 Tax=Armadillidium nasatum TaxID=96803 RepID=A0A5N5TKL3_9CRUS|nr:NAD-dependent protein deacetylase sirtuin-7 [Armadillidium nasatum]